MPNTHLTLESVNRMLSETAEHTSGMIALVPRADIAAKLAIGREPVGELHVTLLFLGEAAQYDAAARLRLTAGVAQAALEVPVVEGMAWATASFNPHTSDQAAVYLIGGPDLQPARSRLIAPSERVVELLPPQHQPWIPHLTVGYNTSTSLLDHAGTPVTFDRVRVTFGSEVHDFELSGSVDD